MSENAAKLGKLFRRELEKIPKKFVTKVRGKGLLNAIVVPKGINKVFLLFYKHKHLHIFIRIFLEINAWRVCLALKENGLVSKPTHDDIIRLAPPLCITEEQILDCCRIIRQTLEAFDK